MDTGIVPIGLKQQTIVPIFKKESKANPANYRPVSLTSHVLKIFGRVLRGKLVTFIESNDRLKLLKEMEYSTTNTARSAK